MSSSKWQTLPDVDEDVVFNALPDGAVLLSTREEVYFGLNRTGARIWELLAETSTLDELCARLGEDFPDAPEEGLREDVVELLDRLASEGLIRVPER
ncbi:MAG TPA: PqqD family protein [Gemmatimonadota bacterium]|nr:PqqD family protein [Gemmatimonadota bacterium]